MKRVLAAVALAGAGVALALLVSTQLSSASVSSPSASSATSSHVDEANHRPRARPPVQRMGHEGGGSDSLADVNFEKELFSDNETGRALQAYLGIAFGFGDDAEYEYQRALASMQAHGKDSVDQLARAYANLDESRYLERYLVTQALGQVAHDGAVDPLAEILHEPYPPERSDDPHYQSRMEEALIRNQAAKGLGLLAADGTHGAEEALRRALSTDDVTVLRSVVDGYLAASSNRDARVAELHAALPAEKHFLIGQPMSDRAEVGNPPEVIGLELAEEAPNPDPAPTVPANASALPPPQ